MTEDEDNGFPDSTCMWCGKDCDIAEWIRDGQDYELWCWCKVCKVDTFHYHKDSKENI